MRAAGRLDLVAQPVGRLDPEADDLLVDVGLRLRPPRLANIITCPVLPPRRLRAFERFIASCVSRQLCLRRMTPRAVR
jgi:hypothetical protein